MLTHGQWKGVLINEPFNVSQSGLKYIHSCGSLISLPILHTQDLMNLNRYLFCIVIWQVGNKVCDIYRYRASCVEDFACGGKQMEKCDM